MHLKRLQLSLDLHFITMGGHTRIIQFFVLLYLIKVLPAAPSYEVAYNMESGDVVYTVDNMFLTDAGRKSPHHTVYYTPEENISTCDYACSEGTGRRFRRCVFCSRAIRTASGVMQKMKYSSKWSWPFHQWLNPYSRCCSKTFHKLQ